MRVPLHKIAALGLAGFCALLWGCRAPQEDKKPETATVIQTPAFPKKIYAHYMGCCPLATGPQAYNRDAAYKKFRHDSSDPAAMRGGHVRNWDLVPYGMRLTPEESADLEIRRAMRIGIDGFAIDAWAGGNDAKNTMDALFKVAEAKDYPFEITVCIDPSCGGKLVDTVKYLLEKHGKSPKLARRDGKPLVFGYVSVSPGVEHLAQKRQAKGEALNALRAKPEGWELIGEAYEDASTQLGQPIYWHFCLSAFFHRMDKTLLPDNALPTAAGVVAKHVQAVGAFTGVGPRQPEVARAVKAAGAEWSAPVGMFQKENIPYENYAGKGLDWLCDNWKTVRESDSRLLQLVTWNDYGENSNIAPAYNTRYTLYDLNGYFIKWWKTGKAPVPDHDKIYLISRKYPSDARVFPFKQGPYLEGAIEVLTLLTKPGKLRLPGRNAEYDAPAGFFRKQFPVTPGPVAAELSREGQVVVRLDSPEPITDRPFREDNSMVCISTEFDRYWKADFGDAKPYLWSEYGDLDGDGLPNWFEMYWFGKFGDLSTATCANPKTLAPSGKTLLQEYLDQTDPTVKPLPYSALPVNGLMAWYRSDQGVVANEKGVVSVWKDQSGNRLDLMVDSAANKPRLVADCWNGLPALEFDGKRNSMRCKLPDQERASMTVLAVFSARAKEQECRMQEGIANRLVSIPTTNKADYEGGVALCVGSIDYPPGGVAVAKREFADGEHPLFLGIGFMLCPKDMNYRNWNFKGKVAEILVYSPALSDADTRNAVAILKARYKL